MPWTWAPFDHHERCSQVSLYAGSYNDGQTAARHSVTVIPEAGGLRIDDENGERLELWPYAELRLVDEALAGRPVRLKCGEGGKARLTVPSHRLLTELIPLAPQLRRGRTRVGVLRTLGLGLAGIALVVGVVWVVLPQAARMAALWIPVSWEEALGEHAMDQMIGFFELLGDKKPEFCARPAGRAALDRLSVRLAGGTDSPYDFRIFVLDLKIPNAFALPGGSVVLFNGLIKEAKTPEEVAGVLAHEMGHVAHRHGTQILLRNMGLDILFDLMLGGMGGGSIVSFSYSREAEMEADTAALELLRKTGIRAGGLAAFFKRLGESQGDMTGSLQLLSTHPSHESRARLFENAAVTGGPGMGAADWTALKAICGAD